MSNESDTTREIAQNQVNLDTAKSLGRIEGNIESILESQKAISKLLTEHDERISTMENALGGIQIKVALASAVVGAIFAAAMDWLWNKLMTRV
jgi:hypothetical protein